MKKIILSTMIVGSLLATSCKKAKEGALKITDAAKEVSNKTIDATKKVTTKVVDGAKDVTKKVVDGAKDVVASVLGGVKIPKFSNPEVTKNLTEYAAYAKDYIAANGNVAKITTMGKKGAELLAKGKVLASKLDAKELGKYKSVLSAIQSKMAPSK